MTLSASPYMNEFINTCSQINGISTDSTYIHVVAATFRGNILAIKIFRCGVVSSHKFVSHYYTRTKGMLVC